MTSTAAPPSQLVQANSATRALNIVGDRWTLMILHLAFLQVRRFDDFQARIGIARSLLTDRLRRLEAAGVIKRVRYQERPPRDEYRLTEMGVDLYSVALMLIGWEKRWRYDGANPSHRLVHSCGHEFMPEFRCGACGQEVGPSDVTMQPGPGTGEEPTQPPRAQRRSIVPSGSLNSNNMMLERALQVLGDRWTSHIIASAFLRRRRFGEFQSALGIASNILTDRLDRLVEIEVLERRAYRERPERFEYRLTEIGRGLFPLVIELVRWGDRWLAGDAGPPLILNHTVCGARLEPKVTCDRCGGTVDAYSVRPPTAS